MLAYRVLSPWLSSRRVQGGAYVAALLIVAAVSYWIFLRTPGVTKNPEKASYSALLYGTADRPYAYRCVLPAVTRGVASVIPASTTQELTDLLDKRAGKWLRDRIGVERDDFVLAVISFGVSYLCFVGFGLAARSIARSQYVQPAGFAEIASLIAVVLLPAMFRYNSYLYDPATLFLFTWALAMLAWGRWSLYLPLFLVAALNKETAVVLVLLFALYDIGGRRMPTSRYLLLGAAQVALFLLAKLSVNHWFAANGGSFVEFHLGRNLSKLQSMDVTTAVAWGALLILIVRRWTDKPLLLREGVWMLVPLAGLAGFLGWFDELRGYYEVYVVILLLVAHGVTDLLNVQLINRPIGRHIAGETGTRPCPP